MPRQTPRSAFEDYTKGINRAIACITSSVLESDFRADDFATANWQLRLAAGRPIALRGRYRRIQFRMLQRFTVRDDGPAAARFRVSPTEYLYEVTADQGSEILSYHLHSQKGVTFPHLHLKAGAGDLREELRDRPHLPSGLVAIQEVVGMLIRDFGVPALRRDWEGILADPRRRILGNQPW
ncbi:MAG: hypothetical protein ACKVVT_02330 [Dehalococcoidia bacterium]